MFLVLSANTYVFFEALMFVRSSFTMLRKRSLIAEVNCKTINA